MIKSASELNVNRFNSFFRLVIGQWNCENKIEPPKLQLNTISLLIYLCSNFSGVCSGNVIVWNKFTFSYKFLNVPAQ